MSEVKEVLIKARALIENSVNWTKGAFARTAGGAMTSPNAPEACRFCSMGAVQKITGFDTEAQIHLYRAVGDRLWKGSNGVGAVSMNDDYGHLCVLAMFDKAIEDA